MAIHWRIEIGACSAQVSRLGVLVAGSEGKTAGQGPPHNAGGGALWGRFPGTKSDALGRKAPALAASLAGHCALMHGQGRAGATKLWRQPVKVRLVEKVPTLGTGKTDYKALRAMVEEK